MEVFPGVSMDPDIRFGKPCLSGTRIDVATIVGASRLNTSSRSGGAAHRIRESANDSSVAQPRIVEQPRRSEWQNG
jgi:hypothetical protein